MLTRFRKYREQQAKIASHQAPTRTATRRRTRAEALVNGLGALERRIADLAFPAFTAEERDLIVQTMNALKETLDEALERAKQGGKPPA